MADLEAVISGAMDTARDNGEMDAADPVESGTDDSGTDTGTDEAVVADEVVEPTAVVAEPDAAKVAAEKVVTDAEEAFAKEHGLEVPKQGKRENRIPYPQVKKIVGNAEKKLIAKALGRALTDGEDHNKSFSDFIAEIPTLRTRITEYEGETTAARNVEKVMAESPEQFLALLPYVNPRYAELLGGLVNKPAAKAAEVVDLGDEMPAPDDEGGYTPAGLKKLLDWNAQQVEKRLMGTIKPLKDRVDAEAQVEALKPRIQARVDYARANWKGFRGNEEAIIAVITEGNRTNRPVDLHDAYIRVMDAKFEEASTKLTEAEKRATEAEATGRKKALDEIKNAPTSTTVVANTSTGRTADPDKPKDMEEVIRASMRKANLK